MYRVQSKEHPITDMSQMKTDHTYAIVNKGNCLEKLI